MSGESVPQHELPQRFEHKGKRSNPRALKAAGLSMACLAIAVVVVTMVLLIDLGAILFWLVFGVMLCGFWLLMKARLVRSIADVTINNNGLILERPGGTQEIPWSELRWAEQNQMGSSVYLMLYGRDMRLVDQIPKSIERFETLCELVNAQLEERPTEELADALGVRAGVYMRWQFFLGIPIILLGIAMIVMAQLMPNEIPRLNRNGVFGWGDIIDVYTVDSTRWLDYQVVVEDQRGPIEKVKMEPEAWETLKELVTEETRPSVEVVYLNDDLSVSFARGQEMPSSRNSPFATYLKAGFSILLGLALLWSAYAHRNRREKFAQALEQQRNKSAEAADRA